MNIRSLFFCAIPILINQLSLADRLCFSNTIPSNDGGPNKVYINDGNNGRKLETYDNFLSSDAAVYSVDETIAIKMDDFKQLCVQAACTIKTGNKNGDAFQALLYKIKNNMLPMHNQYVILPMQEACRGLFSYIPKGPIHSMVNDKKVKIYFSYIKNRQLMIKYNFAKKDPQHHAMMSKAFDELIRD